MRTYQQVLLLVLALTTSILAGEPFCTPGCAPESCVMTEGGYGNCTKCSS